MLSKTKKLTKGGDNIGRIVIMEFKAQDSTAFDDMLAFVKQHPDFEKLEISYEPTLSLSGLEINLSRRRVINNGQEIELTVKEYDILCFSSIGKFCFSLFIERFVALSYSDAIVSDTVSISHSSDSEKT